MPNSISQLGQEIARLEEMEPFDEDDKPTPEAQQAIRLRDVAAASLPADLADAAWLLALAAEGFWDFGLTPDVPAETAGRVARLERMVAAALPLVATAAGIQREGAFWEQLEERRRALLGGE